MWSFCPLAYTSRRLPHPSRFSKGGMNVEFLPTRVHISQAAPPFAVFEGWDECGVSATLVHYISQAAPPFAVFEGWDECGVSAHSRTHLAGCPTLRGFRKGGMDVDFCPLAYTTSRRLPHPSRFSEGWDGCGVSAHSRTLHLACPALPNCGSSPSLSQMKSVPAIRSSRSCCPRCHADSNPATS
jgi:hypothetical protein